MSLKLSAMRFNSLPDVNKALLLLHDRKDPARHLTRYTNSIDVIATWSSIVRLVRAMHALALYYHVTQNEFIDFRCTTTFDADWKRRAVALRMEISSPAVRPVAGVESNMFRPPSFGRDRSNSTTNGRWKGRCLCCCKTFGGLS